MAAANTRVGVSQARSEGKRETQISRLAGVPWKRIPPLTESGFQRS